MTSKWALWLVLGYVAGSIPFGLLIGKARGVDIRKHGSGNIGATNVGRVLGKRLGIFCFALDVLKGLLPVVAAGLVQHWAGQKDLPTAQAWEWLGVAGAAVLGHVFPVWLGFRGGKGVATALGALLGFWPVLTVPALAALLTWVLMLLVFRYVSLASVVAALLLPVYVALECPLTQAPMARLGPFLVVSGALSLLVIARHHTNIRRLLGGTEHRLGARPAQPDKP